jgi:hypothetical protein
MIHTYTAMLQFDSEDALAEMRTWRLSEGVTIVSVSAASPPPLEGPVTVGPGGDVGEAIDESKPEPPGPDGGNGGDEQEKRTTTEGD